ncbi:hypothetical protein [Desulfoferula mesophila]|uniref:Uncharacterized protein n=1 Tax=Desulfoferula mesophila TaxID=3058419 RepID=A0AAU9F1I3_9BACT|nr:hypothetical protein FAK_22930 [Desulfoferula mesophilus]
MAFYTRTSLTGGELTALPFMSLISCFGSPTSTVNAVDFLGEWLQLPGHPTSLYVETMMISRYGQVALSVMGFAFLTLLMTFNYYGKIKLRLGRLLVCVGFLAVCTAGLAWGGHVLLSEVLQRPQKTYLGFTLPEELSKGVKAKVYESREAFLRENPDAALQPGETVLGEFRGPTPCGWALAGTSYPLPIATKKATWWATTWPAPMTWPAPST